MSHFRERKQKNCFNCNAEVLGKYCHICGQENVEPKQSIGHLISHFFNDVTHFDGKFFSTLGYLIRRPGFLTQEYTKGRRVSYLDPVKMYIFTSAVFFLIFFNTVGHVDETFGSAAEMTVQNRVQKMSDSLLQAYSKQKYDTVFTRQELLQRAKQIDSIQNLTFLIDDGLKVSSTDAYDSLQRSLPTNKKDGFLEQKVIRTKLKLNAAKKADPEHFRAKLINRFIHFLPQILFVSLPLFALAMKLIYLRRKEYYYTDHLIFSIHLYIYTFICLLAIFALSKLRTSSGIKILALLEFLLQLSIFIHQYKAMRHFYQQGRLKTILKFVLINTTAFFLLLFLGAIFFIFNTATFE